MFDAPEQILDYIKDRLEVNRGELGLRYIAYGDEEKIPRFPAVKIASGVLDRELHATRQFQNTFNIDLTVYHGNLSNTHAQRSKADLELATAIRQLLHADMTLGGNIVQGWVVQEGPAIIARQRGPAVVATAMRWRGIAVEMFAMI